MKYLHLPDSIANNHKLFLYSEYYLFRKFSNLSLVFLKQQSHISSADKINRAEERTSHLLYSLNILIKLIASLLSLDLYE